MKNHPKNSEVQLFVVIDEQKENVVLAIGVDSHIKMRQKEALDIGRQLVSKSKELRSLKRGKK